MSMQRVLQVILDELEELATNQNIALSIDTIGDVRLEDLMLDSLETLQLAMNLEDRLGIELDIVDFPRQATMRELAQHLSSLEQQ